MNALFVFYFYVFFSEKPKCFKHTFAERDTFFVIKLVRNMLFSSRLIKVNKIDEKQLEE